MIGTHRSLDYFKHLANTHQNVYAVIDINSKATTITGGQAEQIFIATKITDPRFATDLCNCDSDLTVST